MTCDSRGVSEVLGFILSFSIIMLAVGVTYAGGFGAVVDMQTSERADNAERAMVALAETFDDLERGDGPVRAGEIRLDGGTLSVDQSPAFDVSVNENDNGTGDPLPEPGPLGSLTYSQGQTSIRYASGAVLRSDNGNALVQHSPEMTCSDDFAIVSLVKINSPDSVSAVSSAESVLVSVSKPEPSGSELLYPRWENENKSGPAADNVTVSIEESPHGTAWRDWFEGQNDWEKQDDGEYECSNIDEVFVRQTNVEIELIQ